MNDIEKFKHVLEYFIAHLNYVCGSQNNQGFNEYLSQRLSEHNFNQVGQGYKGDNIQNQIKVWESINSHTLCINIQTHYGKRIVTKKCYLNWIDTGINIFAHWDKNQKTVNGLAIGYCYGWRPANNKYEEIKVQSIQQLGLFTNGINNELKDFFNSFCKEIEDYDKQQGNYYNEYNQYTRMKSINIYLPPMLNSHNLILTGAPGTGKTYLAKGIAKSLACNNYEMVQFHPSYDYSDFVEGLRPAKDAKGNIGFERKDGVFKAFCKKALNDGYEKTVEGWIYKGEDAPKYVFIIDEINRGEMSKIFGELFFSIDPGYRGTKGRIKTQYQNLVDFEIDANGQKTTEVDVFKDGFFVPENVYIIGTMNDIDRSVESMDFAMRRRFAFKEVRATDRESMLDEKITDSTIRNEAINRMRNVNYRIQTIEGLNEAYHIGPAYFGKLEGGDFDGLWKNHIKGLLYEYLRGMPNAKELLDSLHRAYGVKDACAISNSKGDLELGSSKSEYWQNSVINKQ